MKKGILFLLIFTLTNCGYQPLYSKKETKVLIVNELELIGDSNINKKIASALSISIDKNMSLTNKIVLENNKTIVETSKNKKGQPDSFKMIIDFKFLLMDKENKFDLSQYEINIEQNLINKIIEKLTLHMSI